MEFSVSQASLIFQKRFPDAICSFMGITHISEKISGCNLQFHGQHSYFRKKFLMQFAVSWASLIFQKKIPDAICSFMGITHISEKISGCNLQFHGQHSYFRKKFQMQFAVSLASLIFQKKFPDAICSFMGITHISEKISRCNLQFHGQHSYFRKKFQMQFAVSRASLIFQQRLPDAVCC